jgi:formylglycine-generating enzyme required for sulfatase activity
LGEVFSRQEFAMPRRILLLSALVAAIVVIPTWTAPAPFPNSQLKEITNSIGMRLVLIKPGKFMMGSPADEKDRGDNEQRHQVEITKAFCLGVFPVTQKEYKAVMGSNPSYFSADGDGNDKVKGKGIDMGKFPVEQVSWRDAFQFCEKLTALAKEKEAGRQYRLPTEAEWEYACRAGT